MRNHCLWILVVFAGLLASVLPCRHTVLEARVAHVGTGAGTLDGVHATLEWHVRSRKADAETAGRSA